MAAERVDSSLTDGARISVLLVDDHPLVRGGLRRLLDVDAGIVVVGEASDAETAVEAVLALEPMVVVLDYLLPGETGLVALRRIHQARPGAAVLMLSMRDEDSVVRACLEAGARGYLFKGAPDSDFAEAVRRVARGDLVMPPEAVARRRVDRPGVERLTAREREVLGLLCRGRSAREVAAELGLSVFTVRSHRASIMRALGLRRTMALVSYALRHRLVDLS